MIFDGLAQEIMADLHSGIGKALPKIGKVICEDIDYNFALEGGRAGEQRWQKTTLVAMEARKTFPKEGSQADKNSYMRSALTLEDTGALRKSIRVAYSGEESPGHYVVAVDSPLEYAELHEKGGTISVAGESHIVPKRSFLWVADSDLEDYEHVLVETVNG